MSVHPALCNSRRAPVAKGPMVELDLGCAVSPGQCNARHVRAVVRVRRFPTERVGQARRWLDLDVGPGQVEELAVGRLHRYPVGAAHSQLKGHFRAGEPVWTPPLSNLLRIGHHAEHLRRRAWTMPKSLTVSRAATNVMVVARPGHCPLPAAG